MLDNKRSTENKTCSCFENFNVRKLVNNSIDRDFNVDINMKLLGSSKLSENDNFVLL